MPGLLTILALVAFVLLFAGLTEGLVSRAPLSFPVIFLGLGYLLGEGGLGVLPVSSHSRTLEAVGVVTLALVLFLDAVRMKFDRSPSEWLVPSLILGPGTLICLGLVALAAHLLLGTGLAASLLLGAILSSTDPVVVHDIVRDRRIPGSIRQALTVEAATNDVVVLPIVLVTIAFSKVQPEGLGGWAALLAKLLLVGPAIGFALGALGAWLMMKADARFGIRREYQALFGMGLVFAAYTGGTAAGGDGFLAAFAAGAAIAALDLRLCDCFIEYGQATAEMIMLFAFILFGAVLSTSVATAPVGAALALAALTIFVARPTAILIVLRKAAVSLGARAFIGWFGPRGLASLLLALLVVQADLPGADAILAITGIVVTVSVLLHGVTATPIASWYARSLASSTLEEESVATAGALLRRQPTSGGDVPRIDARELARRLASPDPPTVLDVRSRSSYESDPAGIPGDVRVPPDSVGEWAANRALKEAVVAYCT